MTGIGTQIKNALGWFLTRLKGNVVNNLTSTSTDLPLSAAKGKDLQDQITSLNTKLTNQIFTTNRTSSTWLSVAYTSYNICEYTVLTGGIYLALGYVAISETKSDRSYYCALNINDYEVSKITSPGLGGYSVHCPICGLLNCQKGDLIKITAQVNYVNENYAGLATGQLQLIKLY